MPTLYDLPSLLDQNTEDISFSVHFRFVAVPFQMAASTFVFRSWLCEGITVPIVAWKPFAVAISHHSILLIRSPAVRFDACGSESIHAASWWNLAQTPCSNLSARLQICKVRNGRRRGRQGDQAAGRRMVKSEPTPGSLLTSTSPLWARTMALTTLKPRPRPGCDRLLSPR